MLRLRSISIEKTNAEKYLVHTEKYLVEAEKYWSMLKSISQAGITKQAKNVSQDHTFNQQAWKQGMDTPLS